MTMTNIYEYEIIRFALDSPFMEEVIGPFDSQDEAREWINSFLNDNRYANNHSELKDCFRIINRTRIVKEKIVNDILG